jgi:hypothetical protein
MTDCLSAVGCQLANALSELPFSDERLGLAHLSQAAKGVIIEGDSAVADSLSLIV